MPREIFPSSYECDCGHVSNFFENTIRAMKQISLSGTVLLADSERYQHTIVFRNGEMVEIQCPHADATSVDSNPRKKMRKARRTEASKSKRATGFSAVSSKVPPSSDRKLHGVGSRPKFTDKQGQYLAFIHLYTKLHGQPPSELDLLMYFRTSPPSIHQMILTLEKNGLIERAPYTPRSIRVIVPVEYLPELH